LRGGAGGEEDEKENDCDVFHRFSNITRREITDLSSKVEMTKRDNRSPVISTGA
jgi:hypothetical protein